MGQDQSLPHFPHFPQVNGHQLEPVSGELDLKGKAVLVLGGAGTIGSGAVFQFLHHGARVVVVSRHPDQLEKLLAQFPDYVRTSRLYGVVGDYDSKQHVEETYEEVKRHLGNGIQLDHVVSTLGPISLGLHSVSKNGMSQSDIQLLHESLEENLFPTILASQVYLKDLKQKEGSTYTIVFGGYGVAAQDTFPGAWAGVVKNAALEAAISTLISETKEDKVRVNGCGVHFGIVPAYTKTTNQYPVQDTNLFANVFLKVIQHKDLKGQMIHFNLKEDSEHF
ncbi:hypothetical protein BASA81_015740 [Batrachochytrium salamandrivorans]|nr:hypothetical protein BASA81_015740 [Batrachochytrium salamandrivorans]